MFMLARLAFGDASGRRIIDAIELVSAGGRDRGLEGRHRR
jgi:hypothetical protein